MLILAREIKPASLPRLQNIPVSAAGGAPKNEDDGLSWKARSGRTRSKRFLKAQRLIPANDECDSLMRCEFGRPNRAIVELAQISDGGQSFALQSRAAKTSTRIRGESSLINTDRMPYAHGDGVERTFFP